MGPREAEKARIRELEKARQEFIESQKRPLPPVLALRGSASIDAALCRAPAGSGARGRDDEGCRRDGSGC